MSSPYQNVMPMVLKRCSSIAIAQFFETLGACTSAACISMYTSTHACAHARTHECTKEHACAHARMHAYACGTIPRINAHMHRAYAARTNGFSGEGTLVDGCRPYDSVDIFIHMPMHMSIDMPKDMCINMSVCAQGAARGCDG